MSVASGLEHLKPFLPGLEDVLEDPEVSEIMINGPHNVWIEGGGKRAFSADDLVEQGSLPKNVRREAERVLRSSPQYPGFGRYGFRQDDAA